MDFAEIDAGGGPEIGIQLGVALHICMHVVCCTACLSVLPLMYLIQNALVGEEKFQTSAWGWGEGKFQTSACEDLEYWLQVPSLIPRLRLGMRLASKSGDDEIARSAIIAHGTSAIQLLSFDFPPCLHPSLY